MAKLTEVDFDPFAAKPAAKSDPFEAALAAEGITGKKAEIARSIYLQETSGGKNTKTSNAGAVGHMQIIPATFNRMADSGWNINNPDHNIRAGLRYVSSLYDKAGGDPSLTASGYYGGEGAIEKARRGIAVSDPRNPNAPNTLQYGQQVASRMGGGGAGGQHETSGAKLTEVDFDPFAQKATPKDDVMSLLTGDTLQGVAAMHEGRQNRREKFLGMDKEILFDTSKQTAKNVHGALAGAYRNVDAALWWPIDAVTDHVKGDRELTLSDLVEKEALGDKWKGKLSRHEERVQGITNDLKAAGVNTDSPQYYVPKLAAEVVMTAPAGGWLEKGGRALTSLPYVNKLLPGIAAKADPFLTAVGSSGVKAAPLAADASMGAKTLNMLTRSAGGATTAAAQTALVGGDPSSGALAGALLPPGLKLAGEAGKYLKQGAAAIGKHTLGMTTGVGGESISTAYQAGKRGSQAFRDNMRGNSSFDDVVEDAKAALQKMRIDRGAEYRSGMVDISKDKSVIDFKPISDAVTNLKQTGFYKGQQINENAAGTVDKIVKKVEQWQALNPAEYHTPEGLDALKQAIGDIRDTTQLHTSARAAADKAYNAVKEQITAQAPIYSKVMKDYSEATATLKEIETALSLGKKASTDTAVRKLQSLLRNNAQTSYGNRLALAKTLEEKGGANLIDSIAGQTMNAALPRGMVGALQKGGHTLSALSTGGGSIPLSLAMAPFSSPRLIGEAMYGAGRMIGGAERGANRLMQGQIAGQNPAALLEAKNALYRSLPVIANQVNQ